MEFKFLPGVVQRWKSRSGGDNATAHAISGTTAAVSGPYGGAFNAFGGGWDVERSVQEGLERVIWVARCIDAIASNQAKLKFITRAGDIKDGKIKEDKDLDFTLNKRANMYEKAQQFRYRLSSQLLLSKRGAFVEKVRAENGRWRLHLLPPHLVEPIPDPRTFVAGYRLQTATEGEVVLKPEQVEWIRIKPHPIDPYLQLTPLTAAGLAIETDWLARVFNRNFLINDGRPGLLINISGQVNQRDAEEIKRRFTGSPHQAGRTTVIESDGVSVNDLSASPRDLQWLEAITGTKSDILLAFGTPESVLGNASGRTYDNADAEKEVWWEETMIPHCDGIASALDGLTGGVDDDLFLTFDYDEIDVLQRRKRARHEKAQQEFTAGTRTLDQLFEERGDEKWDVPGTRVLILPNGMVIGKEDADVKAVAELPIVGVEQQADVAKEAQRGAEIGSANGQRNFQNIIASRAMQLASKKRHLPQLEVKAYAPVSDFEEDVIDAEVVEDKEHPYYSRRMESELALGNFFESWMNFQEETILGRLGHAKALAYTRHWVGENKAGNKPLRTPYVVDTMRWATGLQSDLDRLMTKVVKEALRDAAMEMDSSGITNVMDSVGILSNPSGRSATMKIYDSRDQADAVVQGIVGPFRTMVQQATARQTKRIGDRISELDANGASMTKIKGAVRNMMGQRGSWRTGLASSLTTSLIEAARHDAFSRAGNIVTKFWNTVEDEHVRPTHEALDGTENPITSDFQVGKYQMAYPGDPRGGPEERMNCRCYTDYAISSEAEELYELAAYR